MAFSYCATAISRSMFAESRFALLKPPVKRGAAIWGTKAQVPLPEAKSAGDSTGHVLAVVAARIRDGFADELWRHTCSEAFLAAGDGAAYHELNFSPSGRWLYFQPNHKNLYRVPGPAQEWRSVPPEKVTDFRGFDLYLDYPKVSRDGRKLAMADLAEGSDVWRTAFDPGRGEEVGHEQQRLEVALHPLRSGAELPLPDDYRWLPLSHVMFLVHLGEQVNSCARSILTCLL